jgi:hypothetical protein
MTTHGPITLIAGEAAKLLGLAPSTLAKLRLSGNGPVYCKLGRRVVIAGKIWRRGSKPALPAIRQTPRRGCQRP